MPTSSGHAPNNQVFAPDQHVILAGISLTFLRCAERQRCDPCVEEGLVIRLHLLFGEVISVTTALKVVEEVQEGLQEIERE